MTNGSSLIELKQFRRFFCCILFLFLSACVFSQGTSSNSKKQSKRELRKTLAHNQIEQLKKSALLVRLHPHQKSIDALRKAGNEEKADRFESRIQKKNMKIVHAFRTYFDFCPVYFFSGNQSQYLLDHQPGKITFLNQILQHDTTIQFKSDRYFIGEFHYTEQGEAKYFSDYSVVHRADFKPEREKNFYGTMERGLYSLLIKNDQFKQLKKPFPYYVKIHRKFFFHIKRSPDRVVKKMNRKLHAYFISEYPSGPTPP